MERKCKVLIADESRELGVACAAQLKSEGYTGLDYQAGVLKKHSHWIREAHDLGLSVNVWTVNKVDDLQYFIDKGVDYITTNEPVLLLDMLKKRR